MSGLRLSSWAALAAAATATVASSNTSSEGVFADGPFRFYPFSSSASPPSPPSDASATNPTGSEHQPAVEVSKRGFDPESLERGAKALREINNSPYSKQVVLYMERCFKGKKDYFFDSLINICEGL